jgi:hypothetical protein
MPVKFQPPDLGSNPIEATGPDRALNCIQQLTSIIQAPDSSPYSKAMLTRVVANEFSNTVGYCFRKLEISPWGDEERAELAAGTEAERTRGA